jgi:hypothetical protein
MAFISPRDSVAGRVSSMTDTVVVTAPEALQGRTMSTHSYLCRFPDTAAVGLSRFQSDSDLLAEYQKNSLALDLVLLLFDKELSDKAKRDLADDLDSMLTSGQCNDYILDIMLVSPLPPQADVDGAAKTSMSFSRVQKLVSTIVESQPRVESLRSAWLAVSSETPVPENVYGAFIAGGVFRQLATNGRTQSDVDRIHDGIASDQSTVRKSDAPILSALVTRYKDRLPCAPPIGTINDRPKVFISHSSQDKPFVRRMIDELVGQNVGLWFDEQSLDVGDSFVEGISKGLTEADYVLIVLSVHSVASRWLNEELSAVLMEEAFGRRITVLPVVIDDCEIPPLLRHRKYADFRLDFDDGLESLLRVFFNRAAFLGDLGRALAAGESSGFGGIVLKTLRKETELELVKPYDLRWIITGVRIADFHSRLVRSSAGKRDWQQDFGKTATPILVGVAHSLLRGAHTQAVIVRLCEALAESLGMTLVWPDDPGQRDDLQNRLYRECLAAQELESDEVLAVVQKAAVTESFGAIPDFGSDEVFRGLPIFRELTVVLA